MQVNFPLAPGVGPIPPGQTIAPVTRALALQTRGIARRRPRIGDFIAATFAEPENPIRRAMVAAQQKGMGCGSACGMGALDTTSITGFLESPTFTVGTTVVPVWWLLAAGAAYYAFGKHRR